MKIAIMQPYLFPYIGYFQLVSAVDQFVIYDDTNYIVKGYINRNRILLEGRAHTITVPVRKASQNKRICDLEIIFTNRKKLLKTIRLAYSKAPCFNSVYSLIEQVLAYGELQLSRFVANSIILVSKYLSIKTEFRFSSCIRVDNDLRIQDRVLAICRALGAKRYINAIGGMSLFNRAAFAQEGIELKFIRTHDIQYKQFEEFIPKLSIIDVMMFNSKEEINGMLEMFELG